MENIEKRAMRSKEADTYLGVPDNTLKVARSTGVLYGQKPPLFLKIGKTVLYLKADLDAWLNQFPRFTNTAQSNLSKSAF